MARTLKPNWASDSSSTEEEEEKDSVVAALPRRPPARSALLESRSWAFLVTAAIAGNTFAVAGDVDQPHSQRHLWHVLEDSFLLFFTLELCIRIWAQRWDFLEGDDRAWNMFDLIIVVFSWVERAVLWILYYFGMTQASIVGVLRAFRLVRIFLTFRLVRHVKHLHLLAQGFFAAMQAVVWIAVLFICEITISAIITTTIVGQHYKEWPEEEQAAEIQMYFGSLTRSMITLFQMVTMDNWAYICNLVAQRMPSMRFFFMGYVTMTGFAMIALLTGVMTEHIIAVSSTADMEDRARDFAQRVENLQGAFRRHCEGLTFVELAEVLKESNVLDGDPFLHARTKRTKEAKELFLEIFRCLDIDGNGRVSWEEFRKGLKYVRGEATSRQLCLLRADVGRTLQDLRVLNERQQKLEPRPDELSSRFASLESKIKELEFCWAASSRRSL